MFPLFRQFLVVRMLERVQTVARENCSGCRKQYRFDTLHPCIKTSILERVEMFLPQIKHLVLENMERLLTIFQMTFVLQDDAKVYLTSGAAFVQELQPTELLDRRYINEDSHTIFKNFDIDWTEPLFTSNKSNDFDALCQQVFGYTDDLDRALTPKVTDRKISQNGYDNDPIEVLADRPASPRPKGKKARTKRQT